MIGSDEFNFHGTSPARTVVGDVSETEYIETFLTSNSREQHKTRLLIDIVCPQPRSRQVNGAASESQAPSTRTVRTNSTSGWRK